jgi:hypothetical protein
MGKMLPRLPRLPFLANRGLIWASFPDNNNIFLNLLVYSYFNFGFFVGEKKNEI